MEAKQKLGTANSTIMRKRKQLFVMVRNATARLLDVQFFVVSKWDTLWYYVEK